MKALIYKLPVHCGGYKEMDEWGWRACLKWITVVGGMNGWCGWRAWTDEGLQWR